MRAFPLACAALALAACSKNDAAEQSTNAGTAVTEQSFGGSDTTAIDAATASDANMAADVEYNTVDLNADDLGDNGADDSEDE